MTDVDARRRQGIEKIRAMERAKLMDWYLANNNGVLPLLQCEDKKPYRAIIEYWLEPPIPKIDNYCLIEEEIGGSWTIRVEVKIQ